MVERATERPLLRVEWNDSCSERTGWEKFADAPLDNLAPSRCVTVGFLLHESEESISLTPNLVAHDYDEDGADDAFSYVMTIPKACITKRTSWGKAR